MKLVIAGLLVFTACAFQLAKTEVKTEVESPEAYCSRQFPDGDRDQQVGCLIDMEEARNG